MTMAFTLRQLQFFLAVVEEGTVSGAARKLSISQSSVSEAVKTLEADLGLELFFRRSRSLEITHVGHQFLRHAKKILADVSDARNVLNTNSKPQTGKLSLGATSLVAGYVLSEILARFRRANPSVVVSAIEDNGEYLEHLLIGGKLDVAVLVTSNLHNKNALQVETLEISVFRLWLPLGHHLASQDVITLDDVAAEPLIMLSVDEIEESTSALMSSLGTRPNIAFRTHSVEAVRSLVATGAGVALLPNLVYRPWSLEGDRIEIRDVSGDLPSVNIGLAWRRGAPLNKISHDFVRSAQTAITFK